MSERERNWINQHASFRSFTFHMCMCVSVTFCDALQGRHIDETNTWNPEKLFINQWNWLCDAKKSCILASLVGFAFGHSIIIVYEYKKSNVKPKITLTPNFKRTLQYCRTSIGQIGLIWFFFLVASTRIDLLKSGDQSRVLNDF